MNLPQALSLTHDSHLWWTLDGIPFAKRTDNNQKFQLEFGYNVDCKSWAEELDTAVDKLVSVHGTALALFYSGGADSELVLRSLIKRGVRPEVHIIEFAERLNEHEVHNAFEVCNELGIVPVVWSHDAMAYIREKRYKHLALRYQCSQIAYLTVLEYARQVDKPVIMGGEIYLQKHQLHHGGAVHAPTEWQYIYREDEDGVTYRYSMDTGHPIINEFFTYTPNLLYSWLTHPTIASVANDEVIGKITLLSIKRGVYEQEIGYKLQSKSKFHGYEALMWANMHVQRSLKEVLPQMQVCRYEYNQLINDLCTPMSLMAPKQLRP